MIIDSHTHNFKVQNKFYNEKDLLASMDEAGIDYSLLVANSSVEDGIVTDQAVKICRENPKLKAIGSLHYPTIDNEQIETLVSYLRTGDIFGVKLYPGYEDFYPLNEKLFPLYEQCSNLNKPIIFHTGVLLEGSRGLLKQVHPLNIDEVANKFPDLKIVMAHFGNPWIVDTSAVVAKNRNVYVDLSAYFGEYQSQFSKEELNFFVLDLTYFKNFVGDFKRCLFGTDWPLYSQKTYLEAVKQLPLSDEEKELVFWKNANEVFDLKI